MKKLLLTLLSTGALVCSANAMAPLCSSMINHYRELPEKCRIGSVRSGARGSTGPLTERTRQIWTEPLNFESLDRPNGHVSTIRITSLICRQKIAPTDDLFPIRHNQ